jgi:glucan phosphoethanolaminetransferase (alkaline phosphatase superfamily)
MGRIIRYLKALPAIISIIIMATFRRLLIRWIIKIALLIHIYLSPIHSALYTVIGLIIAELITGVWAAIKSGNTAYDKLLSKTYIGKIFLYQAILILAYLIETNLTGDAIPLLKGASIMITLTEVILIAKNAKVVVGDDKVLDYIVSKLEKDKKEKEDEVTPSIEPNATK